MEFLTLDDILGKSGFEAEQIASLPAIDGVSKTLFRYYLLQHILESAEAILTIDTEATMDGRLTWTKTNKD